MPRATDHRCANPTTKAVVVWPRLPNVSGPPPASTALLTMSCSLEDPTYRAPKKFGQNKSTLTWRPVDLASQRRRPKLVTVKCGRTLLRRSDVGCRWMSGRGCEGNLLHQSLANVIKKKKKSKQIKNEQINKCVSDRTCSIGSGRVVHAVPCACLML